MTRGKQSDHFTRRARAEGRPARSVYKLQEIERRFGRLKPGQRVLDLGCAPGSWTQWAAQRVGPQGYVLGIDLTPVTIVLPAQAETRVQDVFTVSTDEMGLFDVVLSDMAPATSGDGHSDALRSVALVERTLDLTPRVLKVGGMVVTKVLEGVGFSDVVQRYQEMFSRVHHVRPAATRKRSREVFLVGRGRRA